MSTNTIQEQEYLFIECQKCGDRAKLGKNVGNYWKDDYEFLADFLLQHSNCPKEKVNLVWEE